MNHFRLAILGGALLALTACQAPQSAHQARDDLMTTSGAAAGAAAGARGEAAAMGTTVKYIKMDVRNIRDVERWFDENRRISFD
jgi:hypothetical protein